MVESLLAHDQDNGTFVWMAERPCQSAAIHQWVVSTAYWNNSLENVSSVTWTSLMTRSWEDGTVPQGCSGVAYQSAAACSWACTGSAPEKTTSSHNHTGNTLYMWAYIINDKRLGYHWGIMAWQDHNYWRVFIA